MVHAKRVNVGYFSVKLESFRVNDDSFIDNIELKGLALAFFGICVEYLEYRRDALIHIFTLFQQP